MELQHLLCSPIQDSCQALEWPLAMMAVHHIDAIASSSPDLMLPGARP